MSATVFVVTGQIGHTREFWWDELERLLLQTHRCRKRCVYELTGIYTSGSWATQ